MHHLSLIMLSLLSLLFLLSSPVIAADDPFKAWRFNCSGSSHYNASSSFGKNLNSTLETLIRDSSTAIYSKATVGQAPNQVFGFYLCRGDINTVDCNKCVNIASHDLHQSCSSQKQAAVWYDYCLAYYSGKVLSVTNNSIQLPMVNQNSVSDVNRFNDFVLELMNATADYAVKSTDNLFATGNITGYSADYPTLYGLVQCTPDMSGKECRQCLQELFDSIGNNGSLLYGGRGARIIGVRCNMRYEVNQFFQIDPMIQLAVVSSPSPSPSLSPPSPLSVSPPSPPSPSLSPSTSLTPKVSPPAVTSVLASPVAAPPIVGASGKRTCLRIALSLLIQTIIAIFFI